MNTLFARSNKIPTIENVNFQQFELFITEEVPDINGNLVTIPKSIGIFNISQLEMEKQSLLDRIADLDEKINAINALSTEIQ